MDRPALAAGRALVRLAAALLLAGLLAGVAFAQEEPYYFYHGRDVGSEATFHPLSLLVNSGFGILQYPNRSRDIGDVNFATGWKNVTYNIRHPFRAIEAYGWSEFLGNEFYPKDFSKKNAQYWPNYQNHLIGGGMNYIETAEWYRYHGVGHAKLLAAVTMAADISSGLVTSAAANI